MEREILLATIEKVKDRLLNLGGANYEEDKNISQAEAVRTGNVARDAGIEEWDWPQGVGLYGLKLLQDAYGDDRFLDFFAAWYRRNVEQGLPSRNVNTTAPYLTLVQLLDRLPEKAEYESLCRERAEWLMDGLPKTEDGGFQHVTTAIGDRNGVILNEGQLWADTLFMAVLFLQKAGRVFDRQDWREEALHQVLVHIKYLFDKNTGLLYHGYSFPRQDNFGGIFWCRGDSWFTLGLTLYLEEAEELSPGVRQYLIDTFRAHAEGLRKNQAPSGLFHTVVNDPSSYEEVSGSAAIAAGIIRGIRAGFLGEEYRPCAEKAISAIIANVAEDGTVQHVSAGTAMGMDVEHYKGIACRPMAYGQALTLIALCEALAL
ncbi:MAG: glycoside hydrolase family 88 protein [Clostridia bacterium]|nr:glycoside hydrolase family 88 protein [Clostridia bacterium]